MPVFGWKWIFEKMGAKFPLQPSKFYDLKFVIWEYSLHKWRHISIHPKCNSNKNENYFWFYFFIFQKSKIPPPSPWQNSKMTLNTIFSFLLKSAVIWYQTCLYLVKNEFLKKMGAKFPLPPSKFYDLNLWFSSIVCTWGFIYQSTQNVIQTKIRIISDFLFNIS